MSDLAQVTSTPAVVVPQEITQLNDSQLEAMILQKTQEITNPGADPVVPVAPAVPVVPPTPTPIGQVAEGTQTQGQPPVAQTQAQNETGVATTFAELQQKAGFKSPDDLAVSYQNLRKEFERKSQELARVRTEPVQPQPVAPPVVNDKERMNQAFVNDLSQDPLGTIAAVVAQLNERQMKPIVEQQKEVALKNELIRLSSSPSTATFNLPEVQTEIQAVLNENPTYLGDLAKNMETVYTLALGKLARKGAVLSQQAPKTIAPNPAAGFMEGRNIPTQPQPTDPKTMPLNDLATMIKQLQSQL